MSPGEFRCDVAGCGRSFDTKQGLTMHKTRSHGRRKKAKGTAKRTAAKKKAAAAKTGRTLTLDAVYQDGPTLVLKDGDGGLWVARKVLEVWPDFVA